MSPDKLDTLECERHDADRLYNEALTAFDAALFHPIAPAAASLAVDSTPPPPPSGWRARGLRSVRQWLLPWIERQHAFNARTADAIDALISRDRERAAAFGGFQSALIVFLQRINAFIDTKDKLLSAIAERRLDVKHAIDRWLSHRSSSAIRAGDPRALTLGTGAQFFPVMPGLDLI